MVSCPSQRPEGFGESAIVIDLVKKYLPRAKQSMLHHGPPLGLFALIMAGVSRFFLGDHPIPICFYSFLVHTLHVAKMVVFLRASPASSRTKTCL